MSENWRIEQNAGDYFENRQKKLNLADRRPLVRKASDLVGPGIGASATRITDFNDLLATFDGYYSALGDALNAPNNTENFIGTVVMDAELGGKQIFTGLTSGVEYTRIFLRSPSDASYLTWSAWAAVNPLPPAMSAASATDTVLTAGDDTPLVTPTGMAVTGLSATFSRSSTAFNILRPGIYTGFVRVNGASSASASVFLETPQGSGQISMQLSQLNIVGGIAIPFTFWTTDTDGFIRARVRYSAGTSASFDRIAITRTGDV